MFDKMKMHIKPFPPFVLKSHGLPASQATPAMIAGEPTHPTQAGRRASSADEVEFAKSRDTVC